MTTAVGLARASCEKVIRRHRIRCCLTCGHFVRKPEMYEPHCPGNSRLAAQFAAALDKDDPVVFTITPCSNYPQT